MNDILCPISLGELIDKITILEIKLEMIEDTEKRSWIRKEHSRLEEIYQALNITNERVRVCQQELKMINRVLWQVEDYKRACEQRQDFGESFITASRTVYFQNDNRARIKQQINEISGSTLREIKNHQSLG